MENNAQGFINGWESLSFRLKGNFTMRTFETQTSADREKSINVENS